MILLSFRDKFIGKKNIPHSLLDLFLLFMSLIPNIYGKFSLILPLFLLYSLPNNELGEEYLFLDWFAKINLKNPKINLWITNNYKIKSLH